MARYHGLCLVSYVVEHRIVRAYTLHHIVPVKDDWSMRCDAGNLIPVSESWHQRIEEAYRNGKKVETQKMLKEVIKEFEKGQGRYKKF